MYTPIVVYKGRTTVVALNFEGDVSGDTFVSEIRVDKGSDAFLIATWTPSFVTDGTDGKVILTLDSEVSSAITHSNGVMDVKRTSGGEPYPAFDEPLPVVFKETVTE